MRARRDPSLASIERDVVACRRCPRLVRWREESARHPPRRFVGQDYWAKPLPAFGDPRARILLVGLAPAAHGGNRTGRIFTGDESGKFLFEALHAVGLANQPQSIHRDDGLRLSGALVTAACRCAPPANRPLPEELENCREYIAPGAVRPPAAASPPGARGARLLGLPRRARGGGRAAAEAETALRARSRPSHRAGPAARELPPEPAEHVHREADAGDAAGRVEEGGEGGRERSTVDSQQLTGARCRLPTVSCRLIS